MKDYKRIIKRVFLKLLLSLIYISIMGILVYSAYQLFGEDRKIVEWKDVEKTDQYTYLEFNQMSEAFAKVNDKQIHFVMEKESTGAWHTYLIAINPNEYSKYKAMIDYTYKRSETVPDNIKVYGYPVEIPNKVKELAIKNITNFVPIENKVVIDKDNFDKYLTNTYLDTTIEKQEKVNYYIVALLVIAFILFLVFIYTIFEKDKTIPNSKNKKKKKEQTNNDDEIEVI